jgi:N-terminal domain of reverse transcriptase
MGEPIQETQQMTAVVTPAGAVSRNEVDWHAINWQKAHTIVRRLQARIVKATQAKDRGETASSKGRWQGLSCLKGNVHEQF